MTLDEEARHDVVDPLTEKFQEHDPCADEKPYEQERLSLLRQAYGALAHADYETFARMLTDDVKVRITGSDLVPFLGKADGRDAAVEFVKGNFDKVDGQKPLIRGILCQGDLICVLGGESGRNRNTQQEYRVDWIQYFRFANDRISEVREFITPAGA